MNKLQKVIANLMIAFALVMTCGAVHASASDRKVPILMYHNLSTESSDINSMTITDQRFRHDMEFLREYGFTPLLSADLMNIKAGITSMPRKPVMITFDDGYESNFTLGYPILNENKMKATISLITSHIRDEKGGGYPNSLKWDQVKTMYDSGNVDIGSHTYALHNEETIGMMRPQKPNGIQRLPGETYPAYLSRTMFDLSNSIKQIKYYLGEDAIVRYFSYPFGATDAWFGQTLLNNAFYVSTVTQPGIANIANGLYGLPRYRITMDEPVSQLLQHSVIAQPATVNLMFDGQPQTLPAYQIEGSNYVKLRDVAALLNGTENKFSVRWLDETITLRTNEAYERDGLEFMPSGTMPHTGISMIGQIHIDGKAVTLAAYNIQGNYYFKLRSLGENLGFAVTYDADKQLITIQTRNRHENDTISNGNTAMVAASK